MPIFPNPLPLNIIERKCVVYRALIIDMLHQAKSGHPGGSLSLVEIVCLLFNNFLRHNSDNPTWTDRDRFVLSKGHGVPVLYTALADCGHIPKDELRTLRQLGSRLQGHPDRNRLPVVEACTGSLGQGLSMAQGMALAMKLKKRNSSVWCVIGDGESQEGQIWETAMSAPKFRLDNLICILDNNGGQIDGLTKDVMPLDPITDKWKAFNWNVHTVDGHDLNQLHNVFQNVSKTRNGRPHFILAHTVKGKGVSFMENIIKWHGVTPNDQETSLAMEEIKKHPAGYHPDCFGPKGVQ